VSRPLILVTNDDGVRSPGLLAAAGAVCDLGELLIVAPATQQTGMGRGIPRVDEGSVTEERLSVDCHDVVAYGLTGSPALAVLYGVLALAPRRPDLVVSGINYGENLGTSVTSSGTVGAALQAAELGISGLAVSLETDKAYHFHHGHDVDWRAAAHFTRYFAQALLWEQLPFDVDVLKIDIPIGASPETEWRVTRQSRQSYYRVLPPRERPPAGELVRLDYGVDVRWDALEPNSDIQAFARDRLIAVTPLSHDLTSRTDMETLRSLLQERHDR
jgi:5'-nucleotidase